MLEENENDENTKLLYFIYKLVIVKDIEENEIFNENEDDILNCDLNIEVFIKAVKRFYNFINKLGVFNISKNDTKIIGCIWYFIEYLKLLHNEFFFIKNKIEKNTIKKFYKILKNSKEYNEYFDILIDEYYIKIK